MWSGAHLQGQTGGCVQRFEPPAAFAVELQQVGVVLPAERRSRKRRRRREDRSVRVWRLRFIPELHCLLQAGRATAAVSI